LKTKNEFYKSVWDGSSGMRLNIIIFLLLGVMSCNSEKIEVKYYENGDTLSIFSFKDGIKNGKFKFFFINGKIHQEGNFKNGMKDGVFKTYFENGKIREYYVFRNDSVSYLKELDESGIVIEYALGIRYSRRNRENNVINYGDTIHLGYTLLHSMYKKPLIGLDIKRIKINESNSRIAAKLVDSKNIEFNLTEYEIGYNEFVLSVMEFDSDSTFGGQFLDTISFKVLSPN
jgi:hypothetical protein